MLPTKFRVNWPFGSGEEAKNRFSRWWPWQPSWVSNRTNFSYFWPSSHPNALYQVSSQLAFRFRRKAKNRFQDGGHDDHPGFPIGKILAIFDLQVARCFLPSFESIGLSLQEKKQKIDFQDGSHLGFPIGTILAIFFLSTSHPDASYQVWSQFAFWFRRRSEKQIF